VSTNAEVMDVVAGGEIRRLQQPRGGDAELARARAAHQAAEMDFSDEALQLVQRVFLGQGEKTPRAVVFAGVHHEVGCSRMCRDVAGHLALASSGPVCLVEANFRTPALPAMLGTGNHAGLADALVSNAPIRSFAKPVAPEQLADKLWLLSSGMLSGNAPALLTSDHLQTRMAELRREFDFLVIDAPPLTRYADAVAVGQLADGAVLVLKAGSTRKEAANMAAANLRAAQIPILGAVLNDRAFPIPESIYRRL
jgi:Mrp family chromosome partitioning ATPase